MFICPFCRLELDKKNSSYYCKECLKEYPFYIIDDLTVIDFNSLNTNNCECNRDGLTTCKIKIENRINNKIQKIKTIKVPETNLNTHEKFIKNEIGKGNKILDIGCAEGPYSHLFAHDNESYGYDICAKRMLINESNCLNKGYKTLILNNGISTPFPDEFFDVILCTELIEHIVETRQFIAEMNRILRKDGKLILSTPNLTNFGNRVGMLFGKGLKFDIIGILKGETYPLKPWREGNIKGKECSFDSIRYPEQPLHVRFFTFESLRKFLAQAGFTVEKDMGVGMTRTRLDTIFSKILKTWTDDIFVIARKKN